VPENDAPALAEALVQVLTDDARANELGHAARRQALQEHGLGLMRQRYEALILRQRKV
jgi:glycosyltransferase involved in cell wall biosynthesis